MQQLDAMMDVKSLWELLLVQVLLTQGQVDLWDVQYNPIHQQYIDHHHTFQGNSIQHHLSRIQIELYNHQLHQWEAKTCRMDLCNFPHFPSKTYSQDGDMS